MNESQEFCRDGDISHIANHKDKRSKVIFTMRLQGLSFRRCGEEIGVSGTRAKQIVCKAIRYARGGEQRFKEQSSTPYDDIYAENKGRRISGFSGKGYEKKFIEIVKSI